MSRFKYVLISAITFGLFITSSKAATCSYDKRAELNSEAANITANYEVTEIELNPEDYQVPDVIVGTEYEDDYKLVSDALQINVLNLTENFYAEITNDYDDSVTKYEFKDTKNGNISILWTTISERTTFVISIFSSEATGCEGNLIRTLRVSLPRYNDYSTYAICEQIPDYYLCQRYVNFDDVDFAEFSDKVLEETEKRKNNEIKLDSELNWYENLWNFIYEHRQPIILFSSITVAIIGITVIILVIRKRRNKII